MARLYKVQNCPGDYAFDCPGCGFLHLISDKTSKTPGATWEFNGNLDRPTFSPSYLLWNDDPVTKKRLRTCHSYIVDGKIQFLGDCTHELKGQTVDLPEVGDKEI